jgi:hypothetical protein
MTAEKSSGVVVPDGRSAATKEASTPITGQ